jgi:hypothetical protein
MYRSNGYYSKWINPHGAFVGAFLYVLWFIFTSALISLAVHDQSSSDFFAQPIFIWIRVGPIFFFTYAGQFLFKDRAQETPKLARYERGMRLDVSVASLTFMIWAGTNVILTGYGLSLSLVNNLIGGLLFSALILILFGGGGIARRSP